MHRWPSISLCTLLIAAFVTVAHAGQSTDAKVPPPNILLIVLDDFGYWMGKKLGYFDGLEVVPDMQPGPSDGTATVKFVDVGSSPRVLNGAV